MRDDVGQLLWIGFEGTRAPPALTAKLAAGACGATVLFKRNLVIGDAGCDLDALVALCAELHRPAPDGTPALIAIDQEGGTVQRVRAPATVWPPMASFDRVPAGEDAALAEQVGRAMGDELRALGLDVDFAPVLDVHTNPANPIIGGRAFGRDAEAVARRALAFARGLAAAGILACGKHFPGHGDTDTDSHLELPRIDHDWPRLEAVELVPFARAAGAAERSIASAGEAGAGAAGAAERSIASAGEAGAGAAGAAERSIASAGEAGAGAAGAAERSIASAGEAGAGAAGAAERSIASAGEAGAGAAGAAERSIASAGEAGAGAAGAAERSIASAGEAGAAATKAALPMIMTAHVVFAALDAERPATLSEAVVTGLLRNTLGFRGVIVSDDLDMRAIAGQLGADAAAVAAIRAGCDALLLCRDATNQALAEEGLVKAAERDAELRRRIGESAARVRAMKRAHAKHAAAHPAPARDVVGSAAHRRLAERLTRA